MAYRSSFGNNAISVGAVARTVNFINTTKLDNYRNCVALAVCNLVVVLRILLLAHENNTLEGCKKGITLFVKSYRMTHKWNGGRDPIPFSFESYSSIQSREVNKLECDDYASEFWLSLLHVTHCTTGRQILLRPFAVLI